MNTALKCSLSFVLLAVNGMTILAQSSFSTLPPSTQQRVEALLRSKAEFPPATSLSFKVEGPSELPGLDHLSAHFASVTAQAGTYHSCCPKTASVSRSHLAMTSQLIPAQRFPRRTDQPEGGQRQRRSSS